MARNRMIKPEFWEDEKMSSISHEARLTYIALWNFSDDYGVVKGNANWLKNRCYPYDCKLSIDTFSLWIDELCRLKRLLPYKVNGESFFYMPKFRDHQYINRPSGKRNPAPPKKLIMECCKELNKKQ